jgi:hypothetical protein
VIAAPSSDPLRVEALAVETPDGARHLLVANVAPEVGSVVLTGLPDGPVRVRTLDASTGSAAMSDPAGYRSMGEAATVSDGRLRLELGPYAVVRVDVSAASR